MLIEAPEPHRCTAPSTTKDEVRMLRLPDGEEVSHTERVSLEVGSLFKCEECEQKWILKPGDWGTYWTRLRWYHRTTVGEDLSPWEQRVRDQKRRAIATVLATVLMCGIVFVFVFLAMASANP